MVQYVFTPWRDRRDLLAVRRQFYPDLAPPASSASAAAVYAAGEDGRARREREDERHRAVARVSMWMQRGGCPHVVESTALLVAAILSDEGSSNASSLGGGGAATYAVRAAYAATFSRFVTGLMDSHQDKQRKMSMYSVAKAVGLPATFVELRHQVTHELLPSLGRLRGAARKALVWVWDYYWRHLGEENNVDEKIGRTEDLRCRELLLRLLEVDGDGNHDLKSEKLRKEMRRWDDAVLLRVLAEIGETAGDNNGLALRSLRLSRQILGNTKSSSEVGSSAEQVEDDGQGRTSDLEQIRADLDQSRLELQRLEEEAVMAEATAIREPEMAAEGPAWSRYNGLWKPKPIGVV